MKYKRAAACRQAGKQAAKARQVGWGQVAGVCVGHGRKAVQAWWWEVQRSVVVERKKCVCAGVWAVVVCAGRGSSSAVVAGVRGVKA